MEKDTTARNPSSQEVKRPEQPVEQQNKAESNQSAAQPAEKKVAPEPVAANRGAKTGAPTKTEKPMKTEKKRGAGKTIFLLFLLLLIVGGGYYGWTRYGDLVRSTLSLPASEDPVFSNPVPEEQRAVGEDLLAPESVPDDAQGPSFSEDSGYPAENTGVENQPIEELRSLQDQIDGLQLALNSQQERIRELSTTSREDWLLAEAEYLLRLANQRVLTERQGTNALSLMESADAILRELDDPDLFAVRKVLANDITRLRVTGTVDREGVFLKLEALINAIPLLNLPTVQPEAVQLDAPVDNSLAWYDKMAARAWRALKKLSGVVRVEKVELAAGPLLLPSEQQLLRLNLRQALEQAQLALMREEQVVYATSLQRATALLSQHFMVDAASSSAKEELAALAGIEVSKELPTLSPSIKALRDYIALWHNRYPLEAEPESSEVDVSSEMFNAPPVEVVPEPEYLPENEGDQQ